MKMLRMHLVKQLNKNDISPIDVFNIMHSTINKYRTRQLYDPIKTAVLNYGDFRMKIKR